MTDKVPQAIGLSSLCDSIVDRQLLLSVNQGRYEFRRDPYRATLRSSTYSANCYWGADVV
jgi:hypothetical protein